MIEEFAPAKINLYLHITGRRGDGYHELDSLVAFADIGDTVRLEPHDGFAFTIDGPLALALAEEDAHLNLVAAAARSLADLTGRPLDVALTLTKRLPVASGIGGGSADAAAALRALARHWGLAKDDLRIAQAAARHGQDVGVCLDTRSLYMTADGTVPAPVLPSLPAVLVNPNRPLPTPLVYRTFRDSGHAFSPPGRLAEPPAAAGDLIAALGARRNDLYAAAMSVMPTIASVIAALEKTGGCRLARMSGSGATCFGLYDTQGAATAAAAALATAQPGWWVAAGCLNPP